MTSTIPQTTVINIRPIQYRDLEDIARLAGEEVGAAESSNVVDLGQQLRQLRRWYGVLKCVSWFPNPLRSFSVLTWLSKTTNYGV
ncbi:MAG: hypothetical protein EDM05_033470 [Leptolyngbya sp. IPPAS B-1204]